MIFRLFFLIIFIIILVLFTIGYSAFPIIQFDNVFFNAKIYTNKIDITQADGKDNISTIVNDEYKTYSQYLHIACIITSCLIGGGILFSYIGMKFISKILFILSLCFMISFTIIILIIYYSSIIENMIPYSMLTYIIEIPEEYKHIYKSYGSGGILVILSSIIMFVNYTLYTLIG